MCSYKAMILAIKLACAGEEHSASWHVDAHGKCLCGKQGLGWELKKKSIKKTSSQYSDSHLQSSLNKKPCGVVL